MAEIVGLAWFEFEPGERERWLPYAADVVKAVNAEPGCISMDIIAHPDRPDAAIGYSNYASVEAFREHLASAHVAHFGAVTKDIGVRSKKVEWFEGTRFTLDEFRR